MAKANQADLKQAAAKWNGDTNQAPRAAFQFRSECKFAAAADAGQGATVPFTMTARSGEPIDHWYWGRVVHDLAGMQLSKPTLPVDWCHSPYEILGFADKFSADTGDLIVNGKLTPMPDKKDDRATEVIYKQKLGVPYEASIDFSDCNPVIEYVAIGATVDVNGKKFEGPGVVIRQWMLRSVAICPYGADRNTTTEFAAGDQNTVTFTAFKGEAMPEQKNDKPAEGATAPAAAAAPAAPAAPAAAQLSSTPATPATPAAPAAVKPEAKYITAFGDAGARWFLEGKAIEDCVTEFTRSLNEKHAAELGAVQAQLNEANQKLAAIGRGDPGVAFSNAEGNNVGATKQGKGSQNLSEGIGKFAAGIKLPGTAKK